LALNITIKEYVTFRKEGYSVDDIAKKFNLQSKQLKSWVYNHRVKIDKALENVQIPASKEQKVLRAKEVSPQLKENIKKAAEAPGQKVMRLEESEAIGGKVGSEILTFEQIKEKLRKQKNDYEMSQVANEKLSEMYHSLKEDYEAQAIKLQEVQNKAAELDAQYKKNYETAKETYGKQYAEMSTSLGEVINNLREEAKIKDSTIQELTIEAEKQAQADDEIENLKNQLEAAERALQRAFEESERYRTMYEKEVVPLRQLALIKLEADNAQHIQ
jgi:hypothetical protein